MSVEAALFALRLVSALLLIAVLAILFIVLWRGQKDASREAESSRRIYGRIVVLRELNGAYSASGETYPLLPLTSFGRSPTNSIRIDDTFASAEHALVAMRSGQWWLEDRSSRNGTKLNGVAVTHPVIVTDGDVIEIGQMRYRLEMEQ